MTDPRTIDVPNPDPAPVPDLPPMPDDLRAALAEHTIMVVEAIAAAHAAEHDGAVSPLMADAVQSAMVSAVQTAPLGSFGRAMQYLTGLHVGVMVGMVRPDVGAQLRREVQTVLGDDDGVTDDPVRNVLSRGMFEAYAQEHGGATCPECGMPGAENEAGGHACPGQ